MGYVTNDTITTVDHLRDALAELNEGGVDRAAILLFARAGVFELSSTWLLVCTDPDAEWFFLRDPDDTGEWELAPLNLLPLFDSSHLVAVQS
ncbi:hypothetical protein SEA_FIZZLES_64 [Microbacterium phage Fizzles]|nr:hypothetical protein SEA_FIZZLES_64 [Microbacterium phage Fizzles]